ncbi:hypothetical protein UFOVP1299_58 [uncultured Caudovirales phage]|uniref:Uncharacterized protein n=1 Tax=uncultured Caudovirales phage TaxID=2100421 RepID=A0A6J5RGM5_9CAUD|nr:hypothetical protein UFOVP1299_58 [uncultured Caudovirales phage]
MEVFNVTIKGVTPLLMHWDNLEHADVMEKWQKDPANKKLSTPGDDRTPPWRWTGYTYNDGTKVSIPNENIMRCLMEGGAMVSTGKGPKTFKAQTQSGMMTGEAFWTLTGPKGEISWGDVMKLKNDKLDFLDQRAGASALGMTLFVKRATIGTSKHVRVRPRFETWSASGTMLVTDSQLTLPVLRNIFTQAGQYKGLGDWRPGSKTPGPYGMFTATITPA